MDSEWEVELGYKSFLCYAVLPISRGSGTSILRALSLGKLLESRAKCNRLDKGEP